MKTVLFLLTAALFAVQCGCRSNTINNLTVTISPTVQVDGGLNVAVNGSTTR